MKCSTILAFLSIVFTRSLAQSSSIAADLCQDDLTPVLCGINGEEFGNLCLAMRQGGFEESDCTQTTALCAFDYKPVICTSTSTTTEGDAHFNQDVYQNLCTAKAIEVLDIQESSQCTCYEFEELVYLMSEVFGEENCGYITPQPESEEYAQVWYICSSSTTNAKDAKSRPIISAKLIATGILDDFPIPSFFEIYTNVDELLVPTTLPSSNTIEFRNDCHDFQKAELSIIRT